MSKTVQSWISSFIPGVVVGWQGGLVIRPGEIVTRILQGALWGCPKEQKGLNSSFRENIRGCSRDVIKINFYLKDI